MNQRNPDRPLILLADDFEDAREMHAEYLRFSGFDVVVAADGVEAVQAAEVHAPDVILMDVQMPRMMGTEAMQRLRANHRWQQVPIVALTAHALESERVTMLAAGFDEVIPKPCLPDALVEMVRRLLAGAEG